MTRNTDLYKLNGKRIPSVTEVLRFAGLTDYSHVAPEVLEKARLRGRFVADWIDQLHSGLIMPGEMVPPEHKENQHRISAYEEFIAKTGFQVIGHEKVVIGGEGYAGQYDLYGWLPRLISVRGNKISPGWKLIDIKASYQINKTTGPQCAAYENARRQTVQRAMTENLDPLSDVQSKEWVFDNVTTAEIACLHLRPESRGGGWTLKSFDYDKELSMFLSALNVVKFRLENKIIELP